MSDEEVVATEKKLNKRLSSSPRDDEDEPQKKKRAATEASSADDDDEWTVEKCRGDHESVEHWELRKHFLVQNMERFPNRHRLVCLSQVFANMEFLGCRYPEETMELVQELSYGIVESYREKQKTRLQRTFVKASDAAERKTKGSSTNITASSKSTDKNRSMPIARQAPSTYFTPSSDFSSITTVNNKNTSSNSGTVEIGSFVPADEIEAMWPDYRKMILLVFMYIEGETTVQILYRSCSAVKLPLVVEYQEIPNNFECTYRIGKNLIIKSHNNHQTKEAARNEAAKLSFQKLQGECYTFVTKVKVSPNFEGKEIAKDELDGNSSSCPDGGPDLRTSEENIGNKLLKLMGWSGGGLGKNEQGIHEAISANGVVGRSRLGLGNSAEGGFQKKIKDLLEHQKRVGFTHDLKFASDFSKDERAEIHMTVKRLGLKSKSYGKNEDRYIVVSEKVSRVNLLQKTLAEGGETDQYKVIPPGGDLKGIEHLLAL